MYAAISWGQRKHSNTFTTTKHKKKLKTAKKTMLKSTQNLLLCNDETVIQIHSVVSEIFRCTQILWHLTNICQTDSLLLWSLLKTIKIQYTFLSVLNNLLKIKVKLNPPVTERFILKYYATYDTTKVFQIPHTNDFTVLFDNRQFNVILLTFSILYFSIACVAQSTASCCMSSLMSAFLMTAFRSVIFDSFCVPDLER